MSTGMIGFFFGVVVGGLGGIFLLGLFFLVKESRRGNPRFREVFPIPSVAETKYSE